MDPLARSLARPAAPPFDQPTARPERLNVGLLVVLVLSLDLWVLIGLAVRWLM